MDAKKEKFIININKKILLKNKEINLNINNFITFIYGSNGTGKTTISKELKKLSDSQFHFFPFNEFYISENIYFYDQGNIKINEKITANRGQNFITSELKSIWELNKKNYDYQKKNSDEFNINSEYLSWQSKNIYKDILVNFEWNNDFKKIYNLKTKKIVDETIQKIKESKLLNLENFTIEEYFQFFKENFKKYINFESFQEIKTSFSLNEFKEKLIKVKNIPLINKFNSFINELNKFIKNFLEDIDKEIKKYNSLVEDKTDYENSLNKIQELIQKYEMHQIELNLQNREDIIEIHNWLEEGDKIHNNKKLKKICLYCSQLKKEESSIKTNINELINFNWNEVINKINQIISNFDTNISKFENFLKKGEDFELLNSLDSTSKLIKNINLFLSYIDSFKKNIQIQTNKLEKIKNFEKVFEDIKNVTVENFESIKKDVLDYFICENIDNLILKDVETKTLEKIHKKISNNYLKELEEEKLNDITNSLNKILKELDNLQIKPFKMKIKFTKKGDLSKEDYSPLITIIDEESNSLIENISNGQRKMISFIFYTMQLIEINKINKEKNIETIAIIDDVSDGLDFSSYFIVKNIIKNYIGGKPNEIKIVLLTHDYNFSNIYLQSNEDKKFINLFSLDFSGKLTKIDFDIFNMPDLLLAIKIRKDIKNYKGEEQTIVFAIWITILIKIIEMKFIELCHIINENMLIYSQTIYSDMRKIVSNNIRYKEIFELFLNIRKLWLSEIVNKEKEIKNINLLINPIKEFYKYLEYNGLISNIYKKLEEDIDNQFQENIKNFIDFEFNDPKISFKIKNSWDAIRIMMFSKIYSREEINEWERWLSDYLRHSANNVSSPMIALNLEKLKEKIIKK